MFWTSSKHNNPDTPPSQHIKHSHDINIDITHVAHENTGYTS